MNHDMAIGADNRKVAQPRQARLRSITQWLQMMDLGVIPSDLAVDLEEVEPAHLARDVPPLVLFTSASFSSLSHRSLARWRLKATRNSPSRAPGSSSPMGW